MNRLLSVLSVGVFAAGLAVAEPATTVNSDSREVLKQLSSEAAEARKSASEIATVARDKRADLSVVNERLADVEQRAARIKELVAQLENSPDLNLAPAEMDRLKQLAELMNIFLENKKAVATDGLSAADRTALRNHALSVATRAEMIEKTVSKRRS
jgi:homoserine dehydrogenase